MPQASIGAVRTERERERVIIITDSTVNLYRNKKSKYSQLTSHGGMLQMQKLRSPLGYQKFALSRSLE